MGITAIDHLNVLADDVDQTMDFYRRLGLEVVHEDGVAGDAGRPVLRINGVQKINVIPRRGSSPPAHGQHFCMVWDGSMGELTKLLASRGITPESPPSTPRLRPRTRDDRLPARPRRHEHRARGVRGGACADQQERPVNVVDSIRRPA